MWFVNHHNGKFYFDHIIKKHWEKTDDSPTRISVNKVETRITFRIKTEYYLDALMPEVIKLPGSTKSKTIKYKNDKNVSEKK